MKRSDLRYLAALPILAAAWLGAGCVSSQTYKQLQTQSGQQISDLQKNLAQAQGKIADYEKKIADLNTGLDKANAQLKQTTDERDQLRKSNTELSQSLSAKASELAKKISILNDEKQALETKVADLTKAQEELKAAQDRELSQTKNTYDSLVGELKSEITQGQVKITQIQGKLTVNVADKIFFDSGKAEIKEEGSKVLLRLADILKHVTDKRISIEGHTDNKPIAQALQEKYPTNWELSTARATTVARFLQEKGGIDPALLSAVGYGEFHPIAANDTLEGRAKNRRIEIVLLDKEVGQAAAADSGGTQPQASTTTAPAPPAKTR